MCGGTRDTCRVSMSYMGLSPRVRGNPPAAHRRTVRRGLSPRVRGNPVLSLTPGPISRSIPARAGEPCLTAILAGAPSVYPRVCGGTSFGTDPFIALSGLSPRVRGNRRYPLISALLTRSIPACAGEPPGNSIRSRAPWVYPRVCGGTAGRGDGVDAQCGLSPRVRGNHS